MRAIRPARPRQRRQSLPAADALARLRELYRGLDKPRSAEQIAAADAACHGPLLERQRELDLKGQE